MELGDSDQRPPPWAPEITQPGEATPLGRLCAGSGFSPLFLLRGSSWSLVPEGSGRQGDAPAASLPLAAPGQLRRRVDAGRQGKGEARQAHGVQGQGWH